MFGSHFSDSHSNKLWFGTYVAIVVLACSQTFIFFRKILARARARGAREACRATRSHARQYLTKKINVCEQAIVVFAAQCQPISLNSTLEQYVYSIRYPCPLCQSFATWQFLTSPLLLMKFSDSSQCFMIQSELARKCCCQKEKNF